MVLCEATWVPRSATAAPTRLISRPRVERSVTTTTMTLTSCKRCLQHLTAVSRRSLTSLSYEDLAKECREDSGWDSDVDSLSSAGGGEVDQATGGTPIHRVVLLGGEGVGKTELARQFVGADGGYESDSDGGDCDDPFLDPDTMSGYGMRNAFQKDVKVDGSAAVLSIIDIPATELYDSDDESFLNAGDAYVLVYSSTDRESFRRAADVALSLRRAKKTAHTPIIIAANKSDLERRRQVSSEEGVECAVGLDCKFIETSATFNHNVNELFEGSVRQLRLRTEARRLANQQRRLRNRIRSARRTEPIREPEREKSYFERFMDFLDRLLSSKKDRVARMKAKSCHNLSVL
ncbi:PREDICTED: GTP-binding protein RAD-like [Branchiostoma belcheri]|uniref:GTP-binding protein REM 2 n=1 Tax=Branchiostoma belcheri TaxID=7741 RepID=A0A6P4ZAJ4_BRABE|nr:PREDICTED: GTP-binding protein RAD-like [Branchiostoma belcheri]